MKLKVQKSTLHTIHVNTKCYFYYSWELLILVKAKIPLFHWNPFVLSLFFMILLKNFKCDRTRVTHPKNPARTHIHTHKSMKLRTSFAPRFPHARVWRTHAQSHTNTLPIRLIKKTKKKIQKNIYGYWCISMWFRTCTLTELELGPAQRTNFTTKSGIFDEMS